MDILIWTLGIVLVLVLMVVKFFHSKSNYWPKRGIPNFKTYSSIIKLLTGTHMAHLDQEFYKRAKEMKVPLVGLLEFGSNPIIFITDLDLMKKIFIKDFDYFMDRRPMELEKTDPMFNKMLLFMKSEAWKELRGKMSPTFTTGKIKRMFEIFRLSSSKLVVHVEKDIAKNSGVVDFSNAFERYTMGVIASSAFGVDANTFEEDDPVFQKMGKKLQFELTFKGMLTFIFMIVCPKLAAVLGLGFMNKTADSFFTQVIKSAIKQREESGERRDDFLQLMLEARNGQLKTDDLGELNSFEKEARLQHTSSSSKQDKVILTDDVIVAQSVLFILAGFDTTQTVLLFLIYELAINQDVQEKLAQEIRNSKEENDGNFTYESVNGLEYLDQVINETLRKYPPVTRLERKTMADYKIPDTDLIIPMGILVALPSYSVQNDEEIYPNPKKFDPERFTAEERNKRHPMAFQSFGHGPRNCIGMRFAMTNVKMVTANLVDQFTFEPSAKTVIPLKLAKTSSLKPEGGITLNVKSRP